MKVIIVLMLVRLMSLCFSQQTVIQTKGIDNDDAELSRQKRSISQTNENQAQLHNTPKVYFGFNRILPNVIRNGVTTQTKPIIKVKPRQQTRNGLGNKRNQVTNDVYGSKNFRIPINAYYRPPMNANNNKPLVSTPKEEKTPKEESTPKNEKNVQYQELAPLRSNIIPLEPRRQQFFMETDDNKENKNNKEDPIKTLVTNNQNESKMKLPSDDNVKHILHTDSEQKQNNTNTDSKDQLSAEIKKIMITNKDDAEVLNNVVQQLPELIKSSLERKMEAQNDLEVSKNKSDKHDSKIETVNLETSKPPKINFNRSDDVLNLLLKPIFRNEFNDSVKVNLTGTDLIDDVVNGNVDSIKITLQNYTEVVKKYHEPEKQNTNKLDNDKNVEQSMFSNNDHVLSKVFKNNFAQGNTQRFDAVYGSYQSPYGANILPYEYPSQYYTRKPNAFIYDLKGWGNIKPSAPINDKNTIWKTWCNTEVVIKTAKNDYTTENSITKSMIRQKPYYTMNDYRSDLLYTNGYIPSCNYHPRPYGLGYPSRYAYPNSWQFYPSYYSTL